MSCDDAYDVVVQACASVRGQALVALHTSLIARRFLPETRTFVRQTHSGHSPKRHTTHQMIFGTNQATEGASRWPDGLG